MSLQTLDIDRGVGEAPAAEPVREPQRRPVRSSDRPRPALTHQQRALRIWGQWGPLAIAFALAIAGALALGATAWQFVSAPRAGAPASRASTDAGSMAGMAGMAGMPDMPDMPGMSQTSQGNSAAAPAAAGAASLPSGAAASHAEAHGDPFAAYRAAGVPIVDIAPPPSPVTTNVLAATQALTRSTHGTLGQQIDVLYATPEYLHGSGQHALAEAYQPEQYLLFFVAETLHTGDMPPLQRPLLVVGGQAVLAESPRVLTDSVHHRTTVVQFPRVDSAGAPLNVASATSMELYIPGDVNGTQGNAPTLHWNLPIDLSAATAATASASRVPFGAGPVLALLGGLLAAMWPCLFQLTAYFIPSMAGLSMLEAEGSAPAVVRARVLRTSLWFVSGIVVVYTLAGAAAGYAVQTPGARSFFETWQRPITIVGAVVVAAMAIRMALRARAPMACHMPVFSPLERLGRSPLGTMVLGVAFATGCMTCFGAALTLGTFTYVASTGSVLMGAVTLFVFSLGFAVPLVIGSLFMARVLPFLERLQRFVPALTLASSAVMLGFAMLLLTDRYHVVSDAIARVIQGS